MVKTYRYKLNPSKAQRLALGQWVGACRFIYNLCLDYKQQLYNGNHLNLSKNNAQKELSAIVKETHWLSNLHSQTVQDVTDRLWSAYDGFFKAGKGFPKFARRGSYRSFSFKQGVKLHPNTNTVQLPKFGKIKFRNSQSLPPDAVIKRATVSEQADGWFISLCVETTIQPYQPALNERVGVDVGIKELAVLSTGQVIPNNKPLYQASERLAFLQQAVSRKKKGSTNRKKAVQRLAKSHVRVRNTRTDYLHKLTTQLLRENQTVVTEQLAILNMVKNHKLARSIMDASWGELNRQLSYKASWYGRTHEQVNPAYTSQDCSTVGCEYRNTELTLAVREWVCPVCLVKHDRDVNAAVNIKNKSVGHTRLACLIIPVTGRAQESPCL